MTVETHNTNTDTKLVASLIKTASEKPLIANSFSLVAGTYSKVSSFVKPVCPTSISTRWEAAETYLVDNQDALVASADEYAYKATLLPALEAETVDHPVDEYAMIYLLYSVQLICTMPSSSIAIAPAENIELTKKDVFSGT